MVDVSSASSAASSLTHTPCMTPTTPVGYTAYRDPVRFEGEEALAIERAELRPQQRAVVPDADAEADGVDEEYSFDLEEDEEDEEDERAAVSAVDEDAAGRGGGGSESAGAGNAHERLSDVSDAYFYMQSASFSCAFSLPKWRHAVSQITPRMQMREERAAFVARCAAGAVLTGAARRALCTYEAYKSAAGLVVRRVRAALACRVWRGLLLQRGASRLLAATMRRHAPRASLCAWRAVGVLWGAVRRAEVRRSWLALASKAHLAALIVAGCSSRRDRDEFEARRAAARWALIPEYNIRKKCVSIFDKLKKK
jgi:hypothetical protein